MPQVDLCLRHFFMGKIKSETYCFFDDFNSSLSFKPEISSGAVFLKKIFLR